MNDDETVATAPQERSVAAILEYRREQLIKMGKPVPASLLARIADAQAEETNEPDD